MARKARRIKRNIQHTDIQHTDTDIQHTDTHHPSYYMLVAKQLATGQQQTWLDILPNDIHELIWREKYKECFTQIQLFGQYRKIIRIYLKQLFYSKYYDDIKFSRDGKQVTIRHPTPHTNRPMWAESSCPGHIYKELCPLFTSYGNNFSERVSFRIFDENIVPDIITLYNICKDVPENWDYMGWAGETAASKFTYMN
jgi:hypothetical protein